MIQLVFVCLLGLHYAASTSPFTADYKYSKEADAWLNFHIVPATWSDAMLRCQLEGGVLASPTTKAMTEAMLAAMARPEIWIGVTDQLSRGEFWSLDGIPLSNMSLPWVRGQPSNANNAEHCLALTNMGTVDDLTCITTMPYLCQKVSTK